MVCSIVFSGVSYRFSTAMVLVADIELNTWTRNPTNHPFTPNTLPPLSLDQVVFGAIQKGKHVVTANKALLAKHLPEITAMLKEHPEVKFAYEAAVCGGIPIIHTLQNDYLGDQVSQVGGWFGMYKSVIDRLTSGCYHGSHTCSHKTRSWAS